MPFASYKLFANREFLLAEYDLGKKSAKQIAKECGCSHSTILKYLREFDIEIRPSFRDYPKGQVPYGKQLAQGKLKSHATEMIVIEKIKAMHAKGFSFHRIAYILNAIGIATKNEGSKWHASTVMKILKASS